MSLDATLQDRFGKQQEMRTGVSHSWMAGGSTRRHQGRDVMQVCINGHVITTAAEQMPEQAKKFCPDCGAATIMTCQVCGEKIPGINWDSGVFSTRNPEAPKYCQACGAAHPWRQAEIANLIDILEEGELPAEDMQAIKEALPDVTAETPRSQSAAMKVRRLMGKMGKPAYDIAIKVLSDLVSETAKKTLFPGGGSSASKDHR